jgi:hypothetical protein
LRSLRNNLIANVLGQGWSGLMNFVFVPVYIALLGIEAYGLIGLYASLQALYYILDAGMSATLNRELARYSHAMQINRTQEHIREIQDSFLVLDSQHYVRRPAASFYRGAIGLGDETEALAMRQRFMEIWDASFPGVSATTAGL